MNICILVVKGFIIGIGKVIPGVSGAMLAMSLGLYEECLEAITHLFQKFKKNMILLSSLGFGIFLAIVLGSKIIAFLLVQCYLPTILLFIGLIIGGLIPFSKSVTKYPKKASNLFLFFICFFIVIALSFVNKNSQSIFQNINISCLYFIMGMIDAATMVIPGISGTAIFMTLGLYENLLFLFANLDSIGNIVHNFNILIPFGVGLGMGILVISVIMTYLLKNRKEIVYHGILGFQIAALIVIFLETLTRSYEVTEIVLGCILLLLGIKMTQYLE